MNKYNASWINALSEERDASIVFHFLVETHKKNVDLQEEINSLKEEIAGLQNMLEIFRDED